ncbi:Rne/Rng family ribonuclease [Metabacillus lacus]|uniref:Rne/Rng family ribonuclease n=1 Tax=Metabacillus lacus TaxID=1983721 RepID=UPI0012AFA9B9
MKKLIINAKTSEKRSAAEEDGRLIDLYIDKPNQQEAPGSIFLGRVVNVLPGMQAAFIDIGLEKNGFLRASDHPSFVNENTTPIQRLLHQGQKLIVQLAKEGQGTKGPLLSGNVELTGASLVLLHGKKHIAVSKKITDLSKRKQLEDLGRTLAAEGEGILFRTSSAAMPEAELAAEYSILQEELAQLFKAEGDKAPALLKEAQSFGMKMMGELQKTAYDEVICDEPELAGRLKGIAGEKVIYYRKKEDIFSHYELQPQIEKLFKKAVWLKSGGYLLIEQTEALTSIDVNSGKFAGRDSKRDTVLQTNLEAAQEAARQIKLRNLSGIILIDFIDMTLAEDRKKVQAAFEKTAGEDSVQTKILGFTKLNILELTRKKTRDSLQASETVPCPSCGGSGKVLSAEHLAFKLERQLWEHQYMDQEAMLIETTEEIAALLKGRDSLHLKQLEAALQFKIYFRIRPQIVPFYQVVFLGSEGEAAVKLLKNIQQ